MTLVVPDERWGWEFREPGDRLPAPFPEPAPQLRIQAPAWPARLSTQVDRVAGRQDGMFKVAAVAAIACPLVWIFAMPIAVLAPAAVAVGALWLGWGRAGWLRRRADARYARWVCDCAARDIRTSEELAHWAARRADYENNQLAADDPWSPLRPATTERVDVFGGTARGWAALLSAMGASLAGSGTRITVFDLSQDQIARNLGNVLAAAGAPIAGYSLPEQMSSINLLAGLSPEEIGVVVAESIRAAEPDAPAEAVTIDATLVQHAAAALSDEPVTFARLHTALRAVMDPRAVGEYKLISRAEYSALLEWLNETVRKSAEPRLFRITAAIGRIAALGGDSGGAPILTDDGAALRVVELSEREPDLTSELLRQLLFQVLLHNVRRLGRRQGRRVVVVAGADSLRRAHVERLDQVARKNGIRLVLLFRHLRDDATDLIGGGEAVVFMRLGNAKEAEQAANFIGKEHRFVASQFTVSRSTNTSTSTSDTTTRGTSGQQSSTTGSQSSRSRNLNYGWLFSYRGYAGSTSSGTQDSTSVSSGTSWSQGQSTSLQYGTSTSESMGYQRTYDYTVTPTVLQGLSPTAFILVDPQDPGSPRLGDCDPAIAAMRRG